MHDARILFAIDASRPERSKIQGSLESSTKLSDREDEGVNRSVGIWPSSAAAEEETRVFMNGIVNHDDDPTTRASDGVTAGLLYR